MSKRDWVQEFSQYLLADGKSPATITSYTTDIQGFVDYLVDKGLDFDGDLKRFYVTAYRKHLLEQELEAATINKKVNSLKAFNQYLISIGATNEQAVQLRKDKVSIAVGSEQQVNVLTEQEIERLLFHLEDTSKCATRDKLIVLLLLYTGIRAGELVSIKLKDLDNLGMTLTIPWGKGGKLRSIPLKTELIIVIQEYLSGERKENKNSSSEYLLLTQRSGKMNRDAINKVLNRIGEETELALHPHKFRHTFCTRLLARNVPITTVAMLAGHARIQTTVSFYINTSHQDKRNAVDLL